MILTKLLFQSILVASFANQLIVDSFLIWQQLNLHQNYETISKLFNDSLQFIQPNQNEINAVNLCNPNQIKSSLTGNEIISFDIHQLDDIIFYLTTQRQVHMMTNFRYNSSQVDNHWLSLKAQESPSKSADNGLQYYGSFQINQNQMFTFYDINPSQIVVDWIHNLLYLVADQYDIHVMSLEDRPDKTTKTAHLIRRQSATIKKMLVCPKLSLIVWNEISWNGMNDNLIQVAQQDGTEIRLIDRNLYTRNYIEDIAIDQIESKVYILSRYYVEIYQLYHSESHQSPKAVGGFEFNGLSRNFAILSPYLIQVFNLELSFYNFEQHEEKITFNERGQFNDNNEFIMLSPQRQPANIKPKCPQNGCKNICVPNGQISPYTCLCFSDDSNCDDYGHHHYPEPSVAPEHNNNIHNDYDINNDGHRHDKLKSEADKNFYSSTSSLLSARQPRILPLVAGDETIYNLPNPKQNEFNDEFWKNFKKVQLSTTTTTTTTTTSTESSLDITNQTTSDDRQTFNLTNFIDQLNRNATATDRHNNLSEVSFWIRLMLFGLNRFKTSTSIWSSATNSSISIDQPDQIALGINSDVNNQENLYPFLRVLDRWIYQHKLALICLIGISLVALMVIVIFVIFLLFNVLSTKVIRINNNSSNKNVSKPKSIEVLAVNKHFRQSGSGCTNFEMNNFGHYATSKQIQESKCELAKKVTEEKSPQQQLLPVPQFCSWTVLNDCAEMGNQTGIKLIQTLPEGGDQNNSGDQLSQPTNQSITAANWEYQNLSANAALSSYVNFNNNNKKETPLYL